MTPLKGRDNIVAVGIVRFGDIRVRNFSLMKNSKDELFLVMPSRDTGKTDKDGKRVFEEIAHPITKELREAINKAAIESYKQDRPVTLRDKEDGKLLVSVDVFDNPYFNRVGKCRLVINDKFVINDIFINANKSGELYVTMPNYKSSQVGKDGKNIFSEIISMGKGFRDELYKAIINEYNLEKGYTEQNRFTIKSRLEQAKEKVKAEPVKETKQKDMVL